MVAPGGGEFPVEAEEPLAGESAGEPEGEGEERERGADEGDAGFDADGVAVVGEPHAGGGQGAGGQRRDEECMGQERGGEASWEAGEGAGVGAITDDAERGAGVIGEGAAGGGTGECHERGWALEVPDPTVAECRGLTRSLMSCVRAGRRR